MPTWPAGLPQYVDISGYGESRPSAKLETQMDSGPAYMRRLYTYTPKIFNITLTLTSEQVDTLDDFYTDDCNQGITVFTWSHPRTYASVYMRFVGAPPDPKYKAHDAFTVSFSVEIVV